MAIIYNILPILFKFDIFGIKFFVAISVVEAINSCQLNNYYSHIVSIESIKFKLTEVVSKYETVN